jgi:pyruvate dehydrogenase E2 component (dihydrolipoamide acetyltransferase)
MLESVQSAPQFALGIDVDVTQALLFREAWMDRVVEETGERLSITAVLVHVVAFALKEFPRANASFQSGRIKLHKQVNIGVAVGTEQGLVVPVIHDADKKSPAQLTLALKGFQEKANKLRFASDDLTGGTFTLSNLGMLGIDRFSAIINPPESAILAAGRIVKAPVGLPDNTMALRPMLSLTLSVDHRSMDGFQGAQFLSKVRAILENPYLMVK